LFGKTCAGMRVTARESTAPWYRGRGRQLCGARVVRDVTALRGRGGCAAALGEAVLRQAYPRLTWWQRGRAGTLPRWTWRAQMTRRRREGERLPAVGSGGGGPGREVSGHPAAAPGGADIRAGRRRRAGHSRRRAVEPSRGALAQGQLWYAACRG